MSKELYRTIIKAVGALPFWTGKRKLNRFLAGQAGSFWEQETPLKRIYLNQRFFGALSDVDPSRIRKLIQRLQQSNYLRQESISKDKPYKVVKFTDRGARKYYNLLVLDKGIQTPLWWLHHVSRLKGKTNSPIATGGQILLYNDTLYLSQTPARAPLEQRIKEEKSVRIRSEQTLEFDDGHYQFFNLEVEVDQGTHLVLTSESEWETTNPNDVGEKLSHYDTNESQVNPPNPYVIEGKLIEAKPGNEANNWLELRLSNDREQTLHVYVKRNQISDELELTEGNHYSLGPLSEYDHESTDDGRFELRLEDNGEIRKRRI